LLVGPEPGESSASEDTVKLTTPEQAVQRFEHYQLVTGEDGKPVELGRGAMGITYKAFDVDLHCPVTLKVIREKYLGDDAARLRFLREARAAARLRHSNVASVFHLGRTGQSYFYAMEFVEGETLENLVKRSGKLEVKLALEIATQVAHGLVAIHEQKLVHRDIKPTNIMVSLKDESRLIAKIIDLGLAKPVADGPTAVAISSPGAFAGTPEFASPEQFAGIDVDIRSDLYSLGIVLWEMVTGGTPFRGSAGELMYQHQHTPLPLEQLKSVPKPVVTLLEMLLEKDPARRFQNPTEMLKAMPAIAGAIEAGRGITRRNLQQVLSLTSQARTRRQLGRQGPKKISVARLPVTGSELLVVRKISRTWMMHGQTRRSMSSQLSPGPVSGSRRSLTIGCEEWLRNTIVPRSLSLAGRSTDRAPVERLRLPTNSLMRLSIGSVIQIHGLERGGRRVKDSQNSSQIAELC
jgi:serine/threonine protein kinase